MGSPNEESKKGQYVGGKTAEKGQYIAGGKRQILFPIFPHEVLLVIMRSRYPGVAF